MSRVGGMKIRGRGVPPFCTWSLSYRFNWPLTTSCFALCLNAHIFVPLLKRRNTIQHPVYVPTDKARKSGRSELGDVESCGS